MTPPERAERGRNKEKLVMSLSVKWLRWQTVFGLGDCQNTSGDEPLKSRTPQVLDVAIEFRVQSGIFLEEKPCRENGSYYSSGTRL